MARTRRKFDEDFKAGAVRIVRETGKPIAQVARELGINEGTLGNWCARERARGAGNGPLSEDEGAELERLRRENAGLARARGVVKGSGGPWGGGGVGGRGAGAGAPPPRGGAPGGPRGARG